MEDFEREILGNTFICELRDKSFKCTVNDIIPSGPDNLPYSLVAQTKKEKNLEIQIMDVERLTVTE